MARSYIVKLLRDKELNSEMSRIYLIMRKKNVKISEYFMDTLVSNCILKVIKCI